MKKIGFMAIVLPLMLSFGISAVRESSNLRDYIDSVSTSSLSRESSPGRSVYGDFDSDRSFSDGLPGVLPVRDERIFESAFNQAKKLQCELLDPEDKFSLVDVEFKPIRFKLNPKISVEAEDKEKKLNRSFGLLIRGEQREALEILLEMAKKQRKILQAVDRLMKREWSFNYDCLREGLKLVLRNVDSDFFRKHFGKVEQRPEMAKVFYDLLNNVHTVYKKRRSRSASYVTSPSLDAYPGKNENLEAMARELRPLIFSDIKRRLQLAGEIISELEGFLESFSG